MFVTSIPFSYIHLLNVIYQLTFDYLLVRYFGWYSFFYFLMSSFLAGSLHPCSGHFIAEHYLLNVEEAIAGGKLALKHTPAEQNSINVIDENEVTRQDVKFRKDYALETFSYYGILNFFTWNVGLHNEHHDFPFVAWSKLWAVSYTHLDVYKRQLYNPPFGFVNLIFRLFFHLQLQFLLHSLLLNFGLPGLLQL